MRNAFICCVLFFTSFTTFSQGLDWAKSLSGSNNQKIYSIAVDPAGNVYSTGEFWGTTDFDPGTGTLNIASQGGADIFVQKYDPAGNLLWAVGLGANGEDIGTAIDVDENGNAYITGAFRGTVDFDPGTSSAPLTTGGYSDIFVLKLDSNGGYVWAKNFKSFVDYSTGHDIKVDTSGNVYTTGEMRGTVDFDPGSGTNIISAGGSDIYIHKLTPNGNLDWVRTYGGSAQWVEEGQTIEIDDSGDIYVSGTFMSTVDFDAGFGVSNLTAVGSYPNVFVLKLKPNADFVWVGGYGSSSNLFPTGADMSISGNNLYITGRYNGTVDFDPGAGVEMLSSNGSGDIYVEKLDTAGNFQWVRSFGDFGIDRGNSITTDYFGNAYITGAFSGTVDFDPDSIGVYNLVFEGNLDAFVLKLNEAGGLEWAYPLADNGADEGYEIVADQFGQSIWTAGSFAGTVDFDFSGVTSSISSQGLADGFIQKLNQPVSCIPTFATIQESACFGSTYTSPSGNYSWSQNGTYTDTLNNVNGCDSILTISLTFLPELTTQLSDSICPGDSYTSPSGNNTWTQPGNYIDTLVSVAGCDSIISIDLSITTIDSTVSQQSNILTANQSGATYQWIDCNSGNALPGETNASFTATSNGNYAVQITYQNCSITSECTEVNDVSLQELGNSMVRVHPNPTSGSITIDLPETDEYQLEVYNSTGQLLISALSSDTSYTVELPEERGIYFLHVRSDNGRSIHRVMKGE